MGNDQIDITNKFYHVNLFNLPSTSTKNLRQ